MIVILQCVPHRLLFTVTIYDGECVEQAVDLNACTAIEYEKKDDAHGVKFICDEKKKNK